MSCRGREKVTILEINSEARIEFFLVFVALVTWGVPAYYGIQIINLENEGVEILPTHFSHPGSHPGKPKKGPRFGKFPHLATRKQRVSRGGLANIAGPWPRSDFPCKESPVLWQNSFENCYPPRNIVKHSP